MTNRESQIDSLLRKHDYEFYPRSGRLLNTYFEFFWPDHFESIEDAAEAVASHPGDEEFAAEFDEMN